VAIGVNWAEIWADDVWGPVWLQATVPVAPSGDTTDGLPSAKTEELVHEVGSKPRQTNKQHPQPILVPKVRKPSDVPERDKPTRKRKAKKEPAFEVQELHVAPQFGADPEISVAPLVESCVSISFHADPLLAIEPGMEFLDDAVAIAIGHPELAHLIGDFLPVPRFDNPQIVGHAS
jgi:hypothetical protein